MYVAIEIFIIICALLLAFDLVFLLAKELNHKHVYPKNASLHKKICEEIAKHRSSGSFSEGFEEELSKKIRNVKNMLTLVDELEQDPEAAQWFRPVIFSELEEYQKKNDYEQSYYAYVVSIFDYSKEKVPEDFSGKFLSFLDGKSLYTFSNTMDAIYKFGETHLLLIAIDKVDERKGFYHKKLLVDGLLASRADFQELNKKIVERFYKYSPFMQDCLLDYLRMNNYDITELCMELLKKKDTESQVRYSAMRYFAKNPTEASKAFFLEVLANDDSLWLEQMLAIQALNRYSDGDVRSVIRDKVTHANWYVRINAVSYLHNHGLTKREAFDILYKRDRYAGNALLYQYSDDKEMTRYIVDTIQLLNQQDEESKVQQSQLELQPV